MIVGHYFWRGREVLSQSMKRRLTEQNADWHHGITRICLKKRVFRTSGIRFLTTFNTLAVGERCPVVSFVSKCCCYHWHLKNKRVFQMITIDRKGDAWISPDISLQVWTSWWHWMDNQKVIRFIRTCCRGNVDICNGFSCTKLRATAAWID